ncbi:putative nuclease HARBI1 isoform X2 [Pleuronectes platessa]|uniref:putative nuclease HARBI1 isoform X2 n=1 Tax=Pleuronectes platessa TaxID=8262 RepID=UPI00232A41A5|nr:putative nuclease HARBI1 isoform X2 [Pleuronectes platessa]
MAARRNALETMEDRELIKRYRLNREGIQLVVDLVRDAITSPTNRNNPISPEIKCLVTLRYLATGKMQLCNADDLAISQPSVSRAINQTINALARPHIIQQFIRFPLDIQQLHRIKANFMAIAGMPGVVGAIDGTHIKIIAPSKDEDVFVNRKKVHSINTQVVFDANFNILDVVAKWPGATHDSRILMEGGLRQLFERHHVPVGCHLLGDSGYPCKTWLLTPYLNPQPGAQLKYNIAHKHTRNVVERGIGQMKRRFHVLHGEIRLTPERASTVITVCAILHNLCKRRNIPQPDDDDDEEDDDPDDDDDGARQHDNEFGRVEPSGLAFRDHFVNTHFSELVPAAGGRGEPVGAPRGRVGRERGGRGRAVRGGAAGRGRAGRGRARRGRRGRAV